MANRVVLKVFRLMALALLRSGHLREVLSILSLVRVSMLTVHNGIYDGIRPNTVVYRDTEYLAVP